MLPTAAISGITDRAAISGLPGLGMASPSAAPLGLAGSPFSFGDLLAQAASEARGTLKTGEAAAISGLQGKISTQSVVEAVISAEQTLQAAIAIRDKVVGAYQEIVRMAI